MLLDKLINYLKLDKQEFLFQFNSHPNYPSALAFSDTLNFMGVRNDAYELDKEYWDELPEEFIAIVDNTFSLVKKTGNNYSIYSDKAKTLNKEELHKKATDFVLLFEKENVENKSVTSYKPFIYAIFAIIAIYTLLNQTWYEGAFNILSMIGVYISLEIFNQKFGNTSTVIGSICGGDAATSQTVNSCNKIIDQDKTSILGLKFSDFSLIYFIGITVLGLFLPATSFIIKGFTLASVIAIGYSLYIQGFVEKAFCRVCLLIISVLIAQLIISIFLFDNTYFDLTTSLLSLILWVASFSLILYLNNTLNEKENLQKSNAKNLRFKRNYELFKRELLEKEKITFTDNETFSVGSKEARLKISIISNPYCGFCKDAHKIMENLLVKYPNDISVQMRFNYSSEKQNEKFTGLISDFMYIYKNKPEKEFLNIVEYWFETKDEDKIRQKTAPASNHENLEALINMSIENRDAGLNFTPIILINGYQFPEKYDREDIYYFIDELTEDEEII
ncbi:MULTISPECIES: vitamin K epoxide reductase family protein [Chryseobacterium]|uniref:Membrane protein/thiol-disulfide isomerase/thioredoxin n=1 Tax=Chryseobacterium geocarposphaerae TaxID=1416776 RepID=A0ABU1LIQ8_9FLAO|nr:MULTISPECIES: vitamin K epoxide reductase family protein [Chryseobacterium]MDR6406440.1 putative membrane protein/thiol-disulfide isomerase/thioredoxin [Chryseobacterium geocarposphaerae]MDR6699876.1 putative membrane protein/thiol-disulfide isomerase/thioredoxin [Chryseobacterium ginsenosidimutans]